MPRLDEFLFDLSEALQEAGYPPMPSEMIKEVGIRIMHPEVREKIESGELTVEHLMKEIASGAQAVGQRDSRAMISAPPDVVNPNEGFTTDATIQNPLLRGNTPPLSDKVLRNRLQNPLLRGARPLNLSESL